jgi:hypothetical protein
MRPRRAGSDVLGYMRTIRAVYPARQKLHWIQDNLSANWTADIGAYAAANKIELVPTPTYASYLNRIESHFRPILEFVFNNTDYPDWNTAQKALADYVTHRNGTDRDRRIAVLERKHRVAHDAAISGQTFRSDLPEVSARVTASPRWLLAWHEPGRAAPGAAVC